MSGIAAGETVKALTGTIPPPRQAHFCTISDPVNNEPVDKGLVLWFPGPNSFTGEDVAEFQVHGSPAVVGRLLTILSGCTGVRGAEPGEFSRRAFENGKLDLSAAEGLADLIEAETEAQRAQAFRQMEGVFSETCEEWAQSLRRCLAWLEAAIDFPDEDLPEDLIEKVAPHVSGVSEGIDRWLAAPDRGRVIRDGFDVAIVGPPNVGKSTLLNALAQRDVAIVSETAGTTRDIIEVRLDLGGYPVVFADTAGLRDSAAADPIEQEGIRRALERSSTADLVLFVSEPNRDVSWQSFFRDLRENDVSPVVVLNKCDIANADEGSGDAIKISARTGVGIEGLLSFVEGRVRREYGVSEHPALTRSRHRAALEECSASLARALKAEGVELYAEDLRLALRAFDKLVGRTDVEDLLDLIFRDFCIGK